MVSKTYLKAVITKLYWNEQKSLIGVGKEIGMDFSHLRKFMIKNLIPVRSRREARKLWWKQQKELEKIKEAKNGSS